MSNKLLLQEEIDALLGNLKKEEERQPVDSLTDEDCLAAAADIFKKSMDQAAAALSTVLNTTVGVAAFDSAPADKDAVLERLKTPHALVIADFYGDLEGSTYYLIRIEDAAAIARLLTGEPAGGAAGELTGEEAGAASEIFNQMVSAAAASMSELVNRVISLTSEPVTLLEENGLQSYSLDDSFLLLTYRLSFGQDLEAEILQIVGLETVQKLASCTLQADRAGDAGPGKVQSLPEDVAGGRPPAFAAYDPALTAYQNKIGMLLDIPLKVTVVLGRAKRPIKEVLGLTPGALVELSTPADDPVEVLVNGTLVARGEIVVVNENFGIRITSIISPAERVQYIGR
ncbi:MAG: flagellar motor switch protein FliN [Peptococcaceae bacterium]|nr:flagellar motor switch protein FliN [Peptococcaceae bacterium]